MCFEKKNYYTGHAIRPVDSLKKKTLIVISLKIEKWRQPTLCRKVNYMWNHYETGQNSSHYIDVIIRIVIFMYITHGILYRVNHNLIRFYKFATNRNPTRKTDAQAFQLGCPYNIPNCTRKHIINQSAFKIILIFHSRHISNNKHLTFLLISGKCV